jgi:hypothetical protein
VVQNKDRKCKVTMHAQECKKFPIKTTVENADYSLCNDDDKQMVVVGFDIRCSEARAGDWYDKGVRRCVGIVVKWKRVQCAERN